MNPGQLARGREFFNGPVLLSIAIFALNNWWLKAEFHNWLTGKLSDFLFCFFFPLYCSAILAFVTRWLLRRRVWFGAVLTLIVFVPMKTSITFSSTVNEFLSVVSRILFGANSVNYLDPTDLIAAPVVLCSVFFALKREFGATKFPLRRRAFVALGLVAVTPLIIGHGAGCSPFPWDTCPKSQSYVVSGSVADFSPISVGNNMNISGGDYTYVSPVSASGVSVPPFHYGISYEGDDSSHRLHVTINDALAGGSAIGEIWVHTFPEKHIKLLHPAARASLLNALFAVNDNEFALPQSSTLAGTSSYTLAGGSTGAEALNLFAQVSIFLNGQVIYARNASDSGLTPPIVFQAAPGDELRILAGGTFPSLSLPSIWLITPSGSGIKLLHNATNGDPASTGVFFDVLYLL